MPDENVSRWKQRGHLYLWQYVENTRNYPGWNLTADKIFCDSFIDLVQRMLTARYNCQKSLILTSPTEEILKTPNNRGGQAKWKSPKLIILKYHKEHTTADSFSLDESQNTVTLSVGEQLVLLNECLQKLPKEIDYCIEIGNTPLWFW